MKPSKSINQDFEFIGKALFFPKEKILAIGDMHLGYEAMLQEQGTLIPRTQINQTKDDLKYILEILKSRKIKLNKLIFLGDIKHYFTFQKIEKNIFIDILNLIKEYVSEENIIIIRGNHDKIENFAEKNLHNFYIKNNIIFIHGDLVFHEIKRKEIKIVVMGHLHPAITIIDKQKIRSEKYKCFLIGEHKGKQVFILPSFFPLIEGTSINEYISEGSCIISPNNLKNFNVFAINEDNSIFNFGKLKNLNT